MDTCCIDKSNAVELSEAINSMFQWYAKAKICYAYLWDVPREDNHQATASKFSTSRWFQRGWTLQELLAPKQVYFYDVTWSLIGTKASMSTVIQNITGIARPFLLGLAALQEASVAQRMSWAAKRVTKRKEDTAYCLLGIFNVMMPMIYGEGEQAFRRLQQEIMQATKDDSILAWGLSTKKSAAVTKLSIKGGLLATSPSDFANCGKIRSSGRNKTAEESFEISSGRLKLHLALYTTADGKTYGLLNCGPERDTNYVIGIPLGTDDTDPGGSSGEYVRPQGSHSVFIQKPQSRIQVKALTVKVDSPTRISIARTRRYWFYIEDTGETGMELVDVFPRDLWQVDHAMIMTDTNERNTQRILARFRARARSASDLLLVLDFVNQEHPRASCHTLAIPRDTDLGDEYIRIRDIEWEESDAQNASDGLVCASVSLNQESVAGQPMFVIRVHPNERMVHSRDGLRNSDDEDEYSTLIDHDMPTRRLPILKLAILPITRKAMVVLVVSSIFTVIFAGVVLGLLAPHSSPVSCTTWRNHSGLAAANLTDSKGHTHRFVFFQECDSSLIVNRWDSENRTWTEHNLNKIFSENGSPIEAHPVTSLAAAATDETFREVRLWYFGPGFRIHSVWLNDPATAGNWAKGDTLDLAVSRPTDLAAAWLSCTTEDCISCWTLALRNPSPLNHYGEIYNVSDTSGNKHTAFSMAFSGVLSLAPQLNNGIPNGLVVVWQLHDAEMTHYDQPLDVESFGDRGEWRLSPSYDLGFKSCKFKYVKFGGE